MFTPDTEAVEIPAAPKNENSMSATDLSTPRKPKAKVKAKAPKTVIKVQAKAKAEKKAPKAEKKVAKVKAAAKGTPGRKRSAVPTTKAQGNVPVALFKLITKEAKERDCTPAHIVNLALRKFLKYED